MITGINESKTLMNHTSCDCRGIFDGRNQSKNGITIHVDPINHPSCMQRRLCLESWHIFLLV